MNKWAHVKSLWDFNRRIVLFKSSSSAEHTESSMTVSSSVSFKSYNQNFWELERAHSLYASSSTFASNAKVVFDMSLVIEKSINAVINIKLSLRMRHHCWNIEEWIERVNAVATFLALKSTYIVTKEHFLDFWVFLKHNSLVKVLKLIKESFSVREIFSDVLFRFAFVELIMHAVKHISQELSWIMLLEATELRSNFRDSLFDIRRSNTPATSLSDAHE
jgi:hypothetical protein